MPVHIEMRQGLLHVTFEGVFSHEDMSRVLIEIRSIEEALEVAPDRIGDMSAITGVSLGFDAMAQVVRERKATTVKNPIRTAIVAPQPIHMGFARMFQTLNDHPQITVRIFPDQAGALAWLRTAPDEPTAR